MKDFKKLTIYDPNLKIEYTTNNTTYISPFEPKPIKFISIVSTT